MWPRTTAVAACTCKIRVGEQLFNPSFVLIQNSSKYVTFSFYSSCVMEHGSTPSSLGKMVYFQLLEYLFSSISQCRLKLCGNVCCLRRSLSNKNLQKQDLRSCLQTWLLEHGFFPSSFAWIVFQFPWFSQKGYLTSTSFFQPFHFYVSINFARIFQIKPLSSSNLCIS